MPDTKRRSGAAPSATAKRRFAIANDSRPLQLSSELESLLGRLVLLFGTNGRERRQAEQAEQTNRQTDAQSRRKPKRPAESSPGGLRAPESNPAGPRKP